MSTKAPPVNLYSVDRFLAYATTTGETSLYDIIRTFRETKGSKHA